ncbi:hypothetical protein FB446DRAFT_618392, partial [Lentinula raphanica]
IYAFYSAEPEIEFKKDGVTPDYFVFTCGLCAFKVKQGIQTGDKESTGNLTTHAKKCWGDEAVNAAKDSTLDKARDIIKSFGKKGQSKLTAALRVTKTWAKMVTARWVSENVRPFLIVQDRCYRWLQKEGRPKQYIPSKETVAKDVKALYKKTKEKLAMELQNSEYKLSIALDTWTSPNHHACMSITVTWVRRG